MAIDPSIPLSVRPAEQIDPMGVLGKVLTLRNMQQQQVGQQQEQQIRQQQIQENQLRLAAQQRTDAGRSALITLLQDPDNHDLSTGQPRHDVIADKLGQAGFPTEAEAWLKTASSNQEALDKLHASNVAQAQAKLEAIGSVAATVKSPEEFQSGLAQLVTAGAIDGPTALKYVQQADAAGPNGWQQLAQQYQHLAPSYRKAAMDAQGKTLEPVKLGPGETFGVPGQPPLATGGSNSTKESKSMLVDGKPAEVVFDNKSGAYTQGGQTIDPSRVKPIPPASLTIRNMNGQAANMPAWSLDDSRPDPTQKNVLDPNIRMTPTGLYQAALNYIANGQFPPTGRGSDPIAVAQRAAITSKVGAISQSSGMDEPALRAFYKSNASSLTSQQKFYDSAQAFLSTADKNSALLDSTLAKIPDTGSPLLNQPLRAISQKALGSVDMAQFKTYLTSVQNEYGKILNNPNLSGQLTDSARSEAQQLVAPDATVAQIVGSLQALRAEGGNRLQSIGDQIQTIQKRMQGGGVNQPPPPPPSPAARATAPKVGEQRLINGQLATWQTINGQSGWVPVKQ